MKVLVTGGNGFLGSHLIRNLITSEHTVAATKRLDSNTLLVDDLLDAIKWHEVDLLDIPKLEEVVDGYDIVIHCAAIVSMSSSNKNAIIDNNAQATANLVNVALFTGVSKIIHISSIATLGKTKDAEVLNEKSTWVHSKHNTPYSISKFKAEQEIWRGHNEGLNVVVLNPSFILGPGNWTRSSSQIVQRIDKGVVFYPAGSTGFVDVNDVVAAIYKCLSGDFNGQRFVINGHNISYQNIMNMVAKRLKKPPGKYEIKPWLGGIAWRLASFVSFFTRQAPVITKETVLSTANNFLFDNNKSKEVLGMEYTDIEGTLDQMVGAYLTR